MPIKVLIVDDHSVVLEGLKNLLSLDEELEIVGAAHNGEGGLGLAQQLQPQVVLVDLLMPKMDGFEVTTHLKQKWPHIKVLILTGVQEEKQVAKAVRVGANGYLLKNMEADQIQQAIKASLAGQAIFSHEVTRLGATNPHLLNKEKLRLTDANPPHSPEALTNREKEIVSQVVQGKANKEIAYALGLSLGTIKSHLSAIMAKLGVQSRAQLAVYASQNGIILKVGHKL